MSVERAKWNDNKSLVVSWFKLYVITGDESNAPVGIVKFFLYKSPESIGAAG